MTSSSQSRVKTSPTSSKPTASKRPKRISAASAANPPKKTPSADAPKRRKTAALLKDARGPQLKVETKFMQHFEESCDFAVLHNSKSREAEVFVIARDEVAKNDNAVWHLCPNEPKASQKRAQIPGLYGSRIAAGEDKDGWLVVFAANGRNLMYARRDPKNKDWSQPRKITPELHHDVEKIVAIYTAPAGGTLYLGVVGQLSDGRFIMHSSEWHATMIRGQEGCSWSPSQMEALNTCCVFEEHLFKPMKKSSWAANPGGGQRHMQLRSFTSAALSNVTKSFAVLEDGNLYHITEPSTWFHATLMASDRPLIQACAMDLPGDELCLFTVSQNGRVFCRPGVTGTVSKGIPVFRDEEEIPGVEGVKRIWVYRDRGQAKVMAIVSSPSQPGQLVPVRLTKYGRDWKREELAPDLRVFKDVEERIVFATDVTVMLNNGALAVDREVTIRASDEVTLTVNGIPLGIGPTAAMYAKARTNAAGMLALTVPTSLLSVPVLQISISGVTKAGEWLSIEQSSGLESKLARTTGADLRGAKDGKGRLLLSEELRKDTKTTDALGDMFKSAFQLGTKKKLAKAAGSPLLARSSAKPGVSVLREKKPGQRLFQPSATFNWQLDFGDKGVKCRRLKPLEAGRRLKQMRSETPPVKPLIKSGGKLRAASTNGSFLDLLDSISNFVKTAAEGVVDLVRVVVNGAKVAFHFVYNGIKSFVEFVINTVRDAFDFVVAVFNSIGVTFKRLFEYLGTLFNWDDILRTQEGLVHMVNQVFGLIELKREDMQKQARKVFHGTRVSIDQAFERAKREIGDKTLGALEKKGRKETKELDSATANNFAYNGMVNAGTMPPPVKPQEKPPAVPSLELERQVEELSDKYSSSAAFKDAWATLKRIISKPDTIFDEGFSVILDLLKAVMLLVVDGMELLTDRLFGLLQWALKALQDVLNFEWEIPGVAALFRMVSGGKELTILNLMGLIIAVPATVLYKVMGDGKAPFADEGALSTFKKTFTAPLMKEAMDGRRRLVLKGTAKRKLKAADNPLPLLFRVFGYVSCFVGISISAASDALSPSPASKVFDVAGLVATVVDMACATPTLQNTGSPSDWAAWLIDLTIFGVQTAIDAHYSLLPLQSPVPLIFAATLAGAKLIMVWGEVFEPASLNVKIGQSLGLVPSWTRLGLLSVDPLGKVVAVGGTIVFGGTALIMSITAG